jgi:hypothetical protein
LLYYVALDLTKSAIFSKHLMSTPSLSFNFKAFFQSPYLMAPMMSNSKRDQSTGMKKSLDVVSKRSSF